MDSYIMQFTQLLSSFFTRLSYISTLFSSLPCYVLFFSQLLMLSCQFIFLLFSIFQIFHTIFPKFLFLQFFFFSISNDIFNYFFSSSLFPQYLVFQFIGLRCAPAFHSKPPLPYIGLISIFAFPCTLLHNSDCPQYTRISLTLRYKIEMEYCLR